MNKPDFITLQTQVTTGRATLPVALVLWLVFGLCALHGWEAVNRLAACVVTGYLLIELNTAYALIRQRTTLHISAFLLLSAAGFALTLSGWKAWVAPLFLLSVHQLFTTYESVHAPFGAFNAMACLGVGSFLFPPMAWLLPVYLIGLYQMRALTLRSFVGGLMGFAAPWWCYFGYAYGLSEGGWDADCLLPLVSLTPVNYAAVPVAHLWLWGALALGSLVSGLHHTVAFYKDKVRTRIHLSFLYFLQIVIYAMAVAQPAYEAELWALQLPLSALLVSHLFMLTHTRVISYYFLLLFLLLFFLPVLSIWIV